MPQTDINALRYPALSDNANGPLMVQQLAEDVDSRLVGRFATTTARDAAITSPTDGMVAYTTGDDVLWLRWNGAWKKLYADTGWVSLTLASSFTAVTGTGVPGAKYRVKNGVCYFRFRITRATNWTGPVSPFSFPTGAIPTAAEYFRVTKDSTDGISSMMLTAYATGLVELNQSGEGGNDVYGAGSFPID